MLNKTNGKESWKKKKGNLLYERKFFGKPKPQDYQKSDRAGSFVTVPGSTLRAYWIGNGAI